MTASQHQPPLHGSFTIRRQIPAPPTAVFAAIADPDLRRRWFRLPGRRGDGTHDVDVREGGHEVLRGTFSPQGASESLSNTGVFLEIVPGRRVVRAYEVSVDGLRRWVSLVTVSLDAVDGGTQLTHTEQYAFLSYADDGDADVAHLAGGTSLQLNGLVAVVAGLASAGSAGPQAV